MLDSDDYIGTCFLNLSDVSDPGDEGTSTCTVDFILFFLQDFFQHLDQHLSLSMDHHESLKSWFLTSTNK